MAGEADNSILRIGDDAAGAVEWVCTTRESALPNLPVENAPLSAGRVLVFTPEDSLSDGASCPATQDFLDVDNSPPWDAWVAWAPARGQQHGPYLLAWVPEAIIAAVQLAIQINPEECIRWAVETDLEHVRRALLERACRPGRAGV